MTEKEEIPVRFFKLAWPDGGIRVQSDTQELSNLFRKATPSPKSYLT